MKEFFTPLHITRLILLISGIVFLFLFAFVKCDGKRNNTFLILGLILGAVANIIGALIIK